MPTYRKLHTKILDSYDFAEMPDDFTRVFWMLLIVVVDSQGRAIDNPAWLRSRMFPLRSDIDFRQINATLDWLDGRSMIVRYQVDGRGYFFIPSFKTYQTGTDREAKSTLPSPPDLLTSNSRVTHEEVRPAVPVFVNESVNESVNAYADEQKNPFVVYESEIGVLTPTISDEIKLAEEEHPPGWVADALCEASRNNKRSWKYTKGILRRWMAEGRRDYEPKKNHTPQLQTIILPDGTTSEVMT